MSLDLPCWECGADAVSLFGDMPLCRTHFDRACAAFFLALKDTPLDYVEYLLDDGAE